MTPGAYIAGAGRACVGAAFATIETALIIARFARRFDFTANADSVRPYARLTTLRRLRSAWVKRAST
jgi:cytochrome P450